MMSLDTGATRPGRRKRPGLLATFAGIALLAAACSGGPPRPGSGSAQNLSKQLDAYASCVRSHGVPGYYVSRAGTAPPTPGTVQEVFRGWIVPVNPSRSAQKTCQHLLPTHTLPTTGELRQQFLQALKSAKCMRSHGYPKWPDPILGSDAVPNYVPSAIDTSSPQFLAAAKTCGV